jgi:hypothetical protein
MVQEMFDDFFGYSKEQVQPSQNVTIGPSGPPGTFPVLHCAMRHCQQTDNALYICDVNPPETGPTTPQILENFLQN